MNAQIESRPGTDHILVVDDDPKLRELLGDYLGRHDYRVTTVPSGREMWSALSETTIQLVILDVMLPGEDGLELCRTLRARSNVPIIMLTARGEETDRIIGLEMGADDYLPKPFNPRELLARVKALFRRARALPAAPEDIQRYDFSGWALDVSARHLLRLDGGVISPLGSAEYRLLKVFLDHPGRVLSREQLMDLVDGQEATPFDRSIDMRISRLRRRLEDDPKDPQIIKTIRNEGYLFSVEVNCQT